MPPARAAPTGATTTGSAGRWLNNPGHPAIPAAFRLQAAPDALDRPPEEVAAVRAGAVESSKLSLGADGSPAGQRPCGASCSPSR